ncbi:autotransporter domain-containing protein [Flavobacterium lindanitolerans]|nr:autotransporter domain-containing protein [Flavobacterium lindanitolerans]
MKRILLLAILLPTFSFAQETKNDNTETSGLKPRFTISGNTTFSDPSQAGLSTEYKSKNLDSGRNSSNILNLSYGMMNYDNNIVDVDGTGFVIELGSRTYIEKGKWDGFYAENFISYGNIKFDENIGGLGKFDGTYSYWSIINPNVGYRFMIGKNVSIDPYVGANWKWEVKGKGDVDNKDVDNFVFRGGIKIGYSF